MRALSWTILALALAARAAPAQEIVLLTVAGSLGPEVVTTPMSVGDGALDAGTTVRLAGAGLLGGAVGLFAGGNLVAWLGHDENCADCLEELAGALVGATIGEGLLLPAGVHLANGRRGRYWQVTLASLGIGAGGVALMKATGWNAPVAPAIAVAAPIAQIVVSIAIERGSD